MVARSIRYLTLFTLLFVGAAFVGAADTDTVDSQSLPVRGTGTVDTPASYRQGVNYSIANGSRSWISRCR